MTVVLVTGASRGLGLELTRQLSADGATVVATCRAPSRATALEALRAERPGQVHIEPLDVADQEAIEACAARVRARSERLDLLVNNAGVWRAESGGESQGPLGALDGPALTEVLRVNAVGALLVTQALTELLVAGGATVAMLSSGLGSLTRNVPGVNYGYALSKAALNMAMRQLAAELGDRGVRVVALDPGWVRTDLGGPQARVGPEESVAALRGVLARLGPEDHGGFFNRHGEAVAW